MNHVTDKYISCGHKKNNLYKGMLVCTAWKVFVFGVILITNSIQLNSISPHSDWIGRDTKYFSVFSSNAGKSGQEKTPSTVTLHAVLS